MCVVNAIIYVSQLDTNHKQQHEVIKHMHHQTHIVYLRSPYSISGGSRTHQHHKNDIFIEYWDHQPFIFYNIAMKAFSNNLKLAIFGSKCSQKPDSTSSINELSIKKNYHSKNFKTSPLLLHDIALKNTFKKLTLSLHYKALKNNFIKLYKKNPTLSSHLKWIYHPT